MTANEQAHPDYNADMEDLRRAVRSAERLAADWQAVADKQRARIEKLEKALSDVLPAVHIEMEDGEPVEWQTMPSLDATVRARAALRTDGAGEGKV